MLSEADKIDQQLEQEEDETVIGPMEEVRARLLMTYLPPVQRKLWDRLYSANEVGGSELMFSVTQKYGKNIHDLLDLFYVSHQLVYVTPGYGARYAAFSIGLFQLLEKYKGTALDRSLKTCFENDFQEIEFFLLQLISDPQLITHRLTTLKKISMSTLQADLGSAYLAGVERLFELVAAVDEQQALEYLYTLLDLGLSLDPVNLQLIECMENPVLLGEYTREWIQRLRAPSKALLYKSDFNSIGAALVGKLNAPELKMFINCQLSVLYNERLLALSKLGSAAGIKDSALLELMVDTGERCLSRAGGKDGTRKRDETNREIREDLRQQILRTGQLGQRAYEFGIKKLFSPDDWKTVS
jgi:hypothetical protein